MGGQLPLKVKVQSCGSSNFEDDRIVRESNQVNLEMTILAEATVFFNTSSFDCS